MYKSASISKPKSIERSCITCGSTCDVDRKECKRCYKASLTKKCDNCETDATCKVGQLNCGICHKYLSLVSRGHHPDSQLKNKYSRRMKQKLALEFERKGLRCSRCSNLRTYGESCSVCRTTNNILANIIRRESSLDDLTSGEDDDIDWGYFHYGRVALIRFRYGGREHSGYCSGAECDDIEPMIKDMFVPIPSFIELNVGDRLLMSEIDHAAVFNIQIPCCKGSGYCGASAFAIPVGDHKIIVMSFDEARDYLEESSLLNTPAESSSDDEPHVHRSRHDRRVGFAPLNTKSR